MKTEEQMAAEVDELRDIRDHAERDLRDGTGTEEAMDLADAKWREALDRWHIARSIANQ